MLSILSQARDLERSDSPFPPSMVREAHQRDLSGVSKLFDKQQTLPHPGDPATRFFRIVDGAGALERFPDDGWRQRVELLLPDDICGLAQERVHSATAVARDLTKHPIVEIERILSSPGC
ncbi:MAG: hypothetical protein FD175_2933 [Beijerinckiaceae bacterium]|nr:MAG: hypothetical protein FD175_2933 [Beijerinckiaceae bacterium]